MKIFSLKFRKIFLGIVILGNLFPAIAFAQSAPAPAPAGSTSKPAAEASKDGNVTEGELFYQFNYKGVDTSKTKIGAVNALPKGTWQKTLTDIIKILLNITGGLALLSFTIAGVLMITARGNTDALDKGKKLLMASIAGLVLIAISYALVTGISQLQFYKPGAGTSSGGTTSTSAPTPSPAPTGDGTAGGGGVK